MTTFLQLKTGLADDLRDATNGTFDDTELGDLINAAIEEVGTLAPLEYQEDITVVADTLTYALRSAANSANPEIVLSRIEVWDTTVIPSAFVSLLNPVRREYSFQSDSGWYVWNGTLYLSNSIEAQLVVGTHVLRTWGYSPYLQLSGDSSTTDVPAALIWAVRECAAAHASDRLLSDRALFQQWIAMTHNTDVSVAGLIGILGAKRTNWERRRRQLLTHRVGS